MDSLHEEFEALQNELKGQTAANAKVIDSALFGGSGASVKDVPKTSEPASAAPAVKSSNVPAPPPMAQSSQPVASTKSSEGRVVNWVV